MDLRQEDGAASEESKQSEPKKRGIKNLTSLSLGWLAEKMRRAERLKEQVANGTYRVDSGSLAKAIANEEPEKKE